MRREEDFRFMEEAFLEAEKGFGHVAPNPLVGSVIVKDGLIIGHGFHKKSGSLHAEIEAIRNVDASLVGSTLYCNLEPCCHENKKTPPCVPVLIESGITRVVIANLDPNPEVSGRGVEQLESAGIEVVVGVLKEKGEKLNEIFFHHITHKVPFIHLKAAQTLDGKIQTSTGDSKWISNEASRADSHNLRLKYDAVLIGRGTLNRDNPKLDIRMGIESNGKIPFKIVLGDPNKFNWDSNLLRENQDRNIFLIPKDSSKSLNTRNSCLLMKGKILEGSSIKEHLKLLYKNGITSILVEGGSKVLTSFIEMELFNRITLYQAPKLIGNGSEIFRSNLKNMDESKELKITSVELIDQNIRIEMEKLCSQEL